MRCNLDIPEAKIQQVYYISMLLFAEAWGTDTYQVSSCPPIMASISVPELIQSCLQGRPSPSMKHQASTYWSQRLQQGSACSLSLCYLLSFRSSTTEQCGCSALQEVQCCVSGLLFTQQGKKRIHPDFHAQTLLLPCSQTAL